LLLMTPAGRFLVRDGREIIVKPEAAATSSDVRVFLMGSPFAALLHQVGVLPLHASCVRVGDAAVAFVGVSGTGKSTLAAYLRQRGYAVLCDDFCPVRVYPGLGAVAFPGFPRLKLWAEALKSLGLDSADCQRPRESIEKYELAIDTEAGEPFLPLRRLYLLCERRDFERDPQGIVPVTSVGRLRVLLNHTYRFRYVKGFGQQPDHLRAGAAVLKSASLFQLWRPWDLSLISDTVNDLEAHWTDLQEGVQHGSEAAAA
jgi:hypothetical protein